MDIVRGDQDVIVTRFDICAETYGTKSNVLLDSSAFESGKTGYRLLRCQGGSDAVACQDPTSRNRVSWA